MSCCGGQAFTYLRHEVPDGWNIGSRAKPMREVTHVVDAAGGGKTDGQVQGLPPRDAGTAGLAAIGADVRESEWAAWYLADLATAYRALGERAESAKAAAEVARIAAATASPRLAARATTLQHSLR
jgi:hypothetical protein